MRRQADAMVPPPPQATRNPSMGGTSDAPPPPMRRSSGTSSVALFRKPSALSQYQTTSISKHYALNNQILAAFESHYENKLYTIAYAIGLKFVETALLEIPKHGYFYSQRHEEERIQSSLDAIRVTEILQQINASADGIGDSTLQTVEEQLKLAKLQHLAMEQCERPSIDQYELERAKVQTELDRMYSRTLPGSGGNTIPASSFEQIKSSNVNSKSNGNKGRSHTSSNSLTSSLMACGDSFQSVLCPSDQQQQQQQQQSQSRHRPSETSSSTNLISPSNSWDKTDFRRKDSIDVLAASVPPQHKRQISDVSLQRALFLSGIEVAELQTQPNLNSIPSLLSSKSMTPAEKAHANLNHRPKKDIGPSHSSPSPTYPSMKRTNRDLLGGSSSESIPTFPKNHGGPPRPPLAPPKKPPRRVPPPPKSPRRPTSNEPNSPYEPPLPPIRSPRLEPPGMEPPGMGSPRMGSPRMGSPRMESSRTESPHQPYYQTDSLPSPPTYEDFQAQLLLGYQYGGQELGETKSVDDADNNADNNGCGGGGGGAGGGVGIDMLAMCYHEDFDSLRSIGRIQIGRINTYQGRVPESTNGCTVIAPLLCIHHFLYPVIPDPGLPDQVIMDVVDYETPNILPQIRTKLGCTKDAFLIPSDAHDQLMEMQYMCSDQFVNVCGGNFLDSQHVQPLVDELSKWSKLKLAATVFYHEHVITILQLKRRQDKRKKEIWFDVIDSLPHDSTLKRLDDASTRPQMGVHASERSQFSIASTDEYSASMNNGNVQIDPFSLSSFEEPVNAARIRCTDPESLMATLRWYACSVLTPENKKYIDNYSWDENNSDFDPRVFQAFIWSEVR